MGDEAVLVHVATGVGNIVLSTPLLAVLHGNGFIVDVLVDGDFAGVGELLEGWDAIRDVFEGDRDRPCPSAYDYLVPAIPPFCWPRFAPHYRHCRNAVNLPDRSEFYRNERAFYLKFAQALGCDTSRAPDYFLPPPSETVADVSRGTVVLAPGCKTGEMAGKRWPLFAELARAFADCLLVGTVEDLRRFDGAPMCFPPHVRSRIGSLSLKGVAATMLGAGAVVANDSGLGHIAGALGAPTILLFGPTPDHTLGRLPPNVRVLRSGLLCEPCFFSSRFRACGGRIDCLRSLGAATVIAAVQDAMAGK